MSVDLLPEYPDTPVYQIDPAVGRSVTKVLAKYPVIGPVRDTVVFFGGWGGPQGGGAPWGTNFMQQPINLNKPNLDGLSRVIGRVQRLGLRARTFVASGFAGELAPLLYSNDVGQAYQFIRSNYDPRGRLVIYGYSAGGMNAMDLARKVGGGMAVYEFGTKTFSPYMHGMSQAWFPGCPMGVVRVDLLVTVDAACGPTSGLMDRTIPRCVRRNLNFWQKFPSDTSSLPSGTSITGPRSSSSGVRSHGGKNTAYDPLATEIENIEMSKNYVARPGLGHELIDEDTADPAAAAIEGVLGKEAPDFRYFPRGVYGA